MLERALRGGEPGLSPERAAATLARSRKGLKRLVQVLSSPGAPGPRRAALYECLFVKLTSWQCLLLWRVYADANEAPAIRAQAAEALATQYTGFRPRWRRRYQCIVESLMRGLEDPEPEVRFWSIYALACLKEARMRPQLQHIAAHDTAHCPGMWSLRQEALWALGRLEGRELEPRTL